MKALLAFLLVNGVFAAANCIAAGIVWVAGNAVLVLAPGAVDNPWTWYGIGTIAVAASIWFTLAVAKTAQSGATP